MGTGAIIVGYIVTAFVWSFFAALFIWLVSSSKIKFGWWLLSAFVVAIPNGLAMLLFPAYDLAPIDSLTSGVKIFVVPVLGVYAVSRIFKKKPLPDEGVPSR
ncbi:hypothetical protein DBR00_11460 [Pseudomonas sp. HMWF032]|nr:hypothetical protein DBR00_11460 [Pseudomonas sp. HMWF032]PTT85347.1 hypothetical protein DBR41_04045 [Pseudomonas sp. HMWF010]